MKLQHLLIEKASLPKTLYHASAYDAKVLKPGFKHTHKLVKWDSGEDNHSLYATTDKQSAIELGIASAIEHKFQLDRFSSHGNKITIVTPKEITLEQIGTLRVYLYAITVNGEQKWIKNHDASNHLTTEFKTKEDITSFTKTKVDVKKWLASKKITLSTT